MKFGNYLVITLHCIYVCEYIYIYIYTVSPDDQQSVKMVEMLPSRMIIPSGMLKFLGNIGQGQ